MSKIYISQTQFVTSAPAVEKLPALGLPEVACIGRSNVGKSSLINFIFNQKKMAHVSKTPGRTRLLNAFSSIISEKKGESTKDCPFMLVDLPGFGFAQISQAQRLELSDMISNYLQSERPIKAIFHLFDARRDPSDEDLELVHNLRQHPYAYCLVITKIDKLNSSQRIPTVKRLSEAFSIVQDDIVVTSVQANIGRDQLLSRMWGYIRGLT